jgi:hypothetical protein
MKNLLIPSMMAVLIQTVCGVEYVTLSHSTREKNIAPGALVEIVGCTAWAAQAQSWNTRIVITFGNGDTVNTPLVASTSTGTTLPPAVLKQKFTNVTNFRIFNTSTGDVVSDALTLKITPPSEIESGGPKTVLVIPEGSEGEFDVVIESSGDLVTWTPMHSQTVSGTGPKTFFRTRIVKR